MSQTVIFLGCHLLNIISCLGDDFFKCISFLLFFFGGRGLASQVALVVKKPPANVGDLRDMGSIPGSGRCPGEGHGNPLRYSYLENPMDRGAWWARVLGVTQSWTQLKRLSMHMFFFCQKNYMPLLYQYHTALTKCLCNDTCLLIGNIFPVTLFVLICMDFYQAAP